MSIIFAKKELVQFLQYPNQTPQSIELEEKPLQEMLELQKQTRVVKKKNFH